jgi:outer membrane protein assembly factor BamB
MIAVFFFGLLIGASVELNAAEWPRFRGPNGSGVSEAGTLPIEFGPEKNLAWRIETPAGNSSPIVTGNRIFLGGYKGMNRLTWCIDLKTGRQLWERSIEASRIEKKSDPNDPASSTPVTDGKNVYALFSGFGLVCYNLEGKELWRTPLDPFTPPHGMSSSPILAQGAVIVLADQISESYIAAFDCQTGKLKWKIARPSFVGGYSTPILFQHQILVPGPAEAVAYAPASGERAWSFARMGVMPIASPICEGDRLFINNSAVPPFESLIKDMKADRNGDGKITPDEFPDPSFKEAVLAIDRSYGNGDGAIDKAEWDGALKLMQTLNAFVGIRVGNAKPKELWRVTRSLPDVPSPLLYYDTLYVLKDNGLLTSLDAESGKVFKQERIEGLTDTCFASPVAGAGKIYALSRGGKLAVIKAAKNWELLGVNDLREECYATPALVEAAIIIRSKKALWCFGDK